MYVGLINTLITLLMMSSNLMTLTSGQQWQPYVYSGFHHYCSETNTTTAIEQFNGMFNDARTSGMVVVAKQLLPFNGETIVPLTFRRNGFPHVNGTFIRTIQGAFLNSEGNYDTYKGIFDFNQRIYIHAHRIVTLSRPNDFQAQYLSYPTPNIFVANQQPVNPITLFSSRTPCCHGVFLQAPVNGLRLASVGTYSDSMVNAKRYYQSHFLNANGSRYAMTVTDDNSSTPMINANSMNNVNKIKLITGIKVDPLALTKPLDYEEVRSINGFGYICKHTRMFNDLSFTIPMSTGHRLMPECEHFSQLVGCPQSFCFSNSLDDAFVDADNNLVLIRGVFQWKSSIRTTLPLAMPRLVDAESNLLTGNSLTSGMVIDAMTEAPISINDLRYTAYYVFSSTYLTVFNYVSANARPRKVGTVLITSMFVGVPAANITYPDAAWFNPKTKLMYIVKDDTINEFSANAVGTISTWTKTKDYPTQLNNLIDAVFVMNSFLFITVNQAYYKFGLDLVDPNPQLQSGPMAGDSSKSSGFFDTKQSCNYSNQDYDHIITRLSQMAQPSTTTTTTRVPPSTSQTGSNSNNQPNGQTSSDGTNEPNDLIVKAKERNARLSKVLIGIGILTVCQVIALIVVYLTLKQRYVLVRRELIESLFAPYRAYGYYY